MNDQVTPQETTELLQLAEKCLDIPGDFVELGCYRGDTSVLLGKILQKSSASSPTFCEKSPNSHANPHVDSSISCGKLQTPCGKPVEKYEQNVNKTATNCGKNVENSPQFAQKTPHAVQNSLRIPSKNVLKPLQLPYQNVRKHLWIYDSFAGLPEKTPEDSSGAGANFQAGELLVTKREVVDKIRRAGLKTAAHPHLVESTVIIKKAWFDQLTPRDLPDEISFAFLDGDLYESIKTSLQLVTPLLAPRGIMVVHDYNNPELPGSSRAVDEWLRQNPKYHLQIKYSLAILRRKTSAGTGAVL